MPLIDIIKKNPLIMILFIIDLALIFFIILFSLLLIATQLEIYAILITMCSSLAGLVSIIIALSLPFIMKSIEEQKKKDQEELDLRNMMIVIRNLMMYCLNYWNLRIIKKDPIQFLDKFRKGSSIFAHIESLNLKKEILHKINVVFREIHEKWIELDLVQNIPRDRYDIYIDDRFLISINYNYSEQIDRTYTFTLDVNMYDLQENLMNLNINIEDLHKSLVNMRNVCKSQFDIDIKFEKKLYINNCKTCQNLEKLEGDKFLCKKLSKEIKESDLNDICQEFLHLKQ